MGRSLMGMAQMTARCVRNITGKRMHVKTGQGGPGAFFAAHRMPLHHQRRRDHRLFTAAVSVADGTDTESTRLAGGRGATHALPYHTLCSAASYYLYLHLPLPVQRRAPAILFASS